jgi:ABC-type glucose/galactose transport system permease subunit
VYFDIKKYYYYIKKKIIIIEAVKLDELVDKQK